MDKPPFLLPPLLAVLLWLAVWACASVWTVVGCRLWRREAVLPCRPRRQVPWGAVDLAIVFVVFASLSVCMFLLSKVVLGPEACRPQPFWSGDRAGTPHVVVQLFSQGGAWTLLLCGLSAVVVAPIVEEFLFRVLLQGWLEGLDRRLRPAMPTLRRWLSWGTGPVLLSSLLFARMHFHVEGPPLKPSYLKYLLIGNAVVSLVTVAFAVVLVRDRTGATAVDLGWEPKKLLADVGLGLATFAGVGLPIYLGQLALTWLLPKYVAADPIPIFFFALVLGTLYCRTHRIVPSIVVHMCLNAGSLLLLWASIA